MPTIAVNPTVDNLQMFLGTIMAVCSSDLGRVPDFQNPNDSIGAVMLNMALNGKTGDDLRAFVRQTPEWHARHDRPDPPPTPITPPPTPVTGPEIRGRLHVDGPRLFDNAGPWRWKIVTAFDALRPMIRNETAQLTDYAACTPPIAH